MRLHNLSKLRNACVASKLCTCRSVVQTDMLAKDGVDWIYNVSTERYPNGSMQSLQVNFEQEEEKQFLPKRHQVTQGPNLLSSTTSRYLKHKSLKTLLRKHQHQMITSASTSRHSSSSAKPGPDLEKIACQLTEDIGNFFMKAQDWDLYHQELVFQDNIRGMRVVGLEKYKVLVNIMRIVAHIRFLYVKMTILSVSKEEEAGIVNIRWRIVGLGMMRLLLRYFPDRLWEKGSMERSAPTYIDGFSIFYVDSKSKIYQHTMDRVMEDKDKVIRRTIVQKLLEFKQKSGTQPAM